MEKHPLSGKHIIVSGGGLAGLAFIRALDRTWPVNAPPPRVTLYERRPNISRDREGYSLGLRSDGKSGGVQALQRLGLLDKCLALSTFTSGGEYGGRGSMNIWGADFKPMMKLGTPPAPPDDLPVNDFRIARYNLRQVLVDGLPKACDARWGVGCESAEELGDGRMRVVLSDGSTDHCDLLVAADGANSKTRASIRPKDGLNFAGATICAGTCKFPHGLPTAINENNGVALGGTANMLVTFNMGDNSAVWFVSALEDNPRETLRGKEAESRKDDILQETRKRGRAFAEPFGQMLETTDPTTLSVFNAMDKPPINHSELPGVPIVFIGDANHAVSPFAGNGANMALMDGMDLAAVLCEGGNIDTMRQKFDKSSMARSVKTLKVSHFVIALGHATGWKLLLAKAFLVCINFLRSRGFFQR